LNKGKGKMGHDEVPPGPLQGRMGTSTRQVSKVDIQRTSKNGLAASTEFQVQPKVNLSSAIQQAAGTGLPYSLASLNYQYILHLLASSRPAYLPFEKELPTYSLAREDNQLSRPPYR